MDKQLELVPKKTTKKTASSNVMEPLTSAPAEVQRIMVRVLKLEQERIDRSDRGLINDTILKIVKEEVQ
ncbi:MAG: hypothetical protein AAGA46_07715 [Cyanobacteria bacterium P01_F01_bin.13]